MNLELNTLNNTMERKVSRAKVAEKVKHAYEDEQATLFVVSLTRLEIIIQK